jgi:hypothetical protein
VRNTVSVIAGVPGARHELPGRMPRSTSPSIDGDPFRHAERVRLSRRAEDAEPVAAIGQQPLRMRRHPVEIDREVLPHGGEHGGVHAAIDRVLHHR